MKTLNLQETARAPPNTFSPDGIHSNEDHSIGMNCLPSPARPVHRLHVCLGLCLTAVVYFTYAWTMLGSIGVLHLLDSMVSSLLGRQNECSSSLEGPCLVDSSVARFVRDHISYAQDIVDIWFDCGLPVSAHAEEFVIRTKSVGIEVKEEMFLNEYPQYTHQYRIETGSAMLEFADRLGDVQVSVEGIGMTISAIFSHPLYAFAYSILYASKKLRNAQIQDTIIQDPSNFFLVRQRAALTKENLLSSIAPMVARGSAETFNGTLVPWVGNTTATTQIAIDSGLQSLRLIEDDIVFMHQVIASIPFYRFWRIYVFIFGGYNPMTFLRPILDGLVLAEKTVRHVVGQLEDVLENLLLAGRYSQWYAGNSADLLASYRRDDLKAFGDEIDDVGRYFEQLLDDCRELFWLAHIHPRDLVGTKLVNRRKNQTTIDG